ncbi:hypothetical protein NCCP2145_10930 [Pseudarthrobacter sp. NCCP-2145]|nr:hypothetical protein NCCP2145_10930 [Pseudarthrobacter sp. NCCP-2145]
MLERLAIKPIGKRFPAGFTPANGQALHHGPQHYFGFHVGDLFEVPQDRFGIFQRAPVFQLAIAALGHRHEMVGAHAQ